MNKIILIITIMVIGIQVSFAQNKNNKALRHVVLFGWDAGTDSSAIHKIVKAFKSLPEKIELIKGFEYGINNSPENLNSGLTHCFTLTFKSEADRDTYLIHPAHKQFVAALVPKPEHITVVDYWVEK